jgi:hypothetical protein
MTNTNSEKQIDAQMRIISAVASAIASLGEVPSGHLYAQVMAHMTLEQYQRVIAVLVRSGLVADKGHLLKWTGPKPSPCEEAKQ